MADLYVIQGRRTYEALVRRLADRFRAPSTAGLTEGERAERDRDAFERRRREQLEALSRWRDAPR